MLCKNCEKSLIGWQKKFCSSSCAAIFNNPRRHLPKRELLSRPNCPSCEKEISRKNKYCSVQCQRDYEAKQKFILIEAGESISSVWIKRYLVEKYGNVCMDPECAWDFSKRSVNVELEHIDGHSDNNSLDNCILLCHCCHSLTPTYKAKNKGNGRHNRRQRYQEGKSF